MGHLYLVRHGESSWNRENRFTGWVDVTVTERGRDQMIEAGRKLRGVQLGAVFASALRRTRESVEVLLQAAGIEVRVATPWELNERFYGRLQGLDREQAAIAFGAEQVRAWRRSYDVRPPGGESLEDTGCRVLPYLEQVVLPRTTSGTDSLVCGHGNTLRVIIMRLNGLDAETVVNLEIPTGALYRYEIEPHGEIGRMEKL